VGAGIKSAAVAVGVKATAVGAAVVASPATPVVVGGAIATGIGYKIYRHFYPTQKAKEQHAESERKIAQDQQKKEEATESSELARCRRERAGSVKGFKDCLYNNRRSRSFTDHGYPKECEDEALHLSLHEDGESEVVSLAKRFVKFAPMKRKEENN
jgi:phosphate/sulfate permease